MYDSICGKSYNRQDWIHSDRKAISGCLGWGVGREGAAKECKGNLRGADICQDTQTVLKLTISIIRRNDTPVFLVWKKMWGKKLEGDLLFLYYILS